MAGKLKLHVCIINIEKFYNGEREKLEKEDIPMVGVEIEKHNILIFVRHPSSKFECLIFYFYCVSLFLSILSKGNMISITSIRVLLKLWGSGLRIRISVRFDWIFRSRTFVITKHLVIIVLQIEINWSAKNLTQTLYSTIKYLEQKIK